jgi:hypothetical protein
VETKDKIARVSTRILACWSWRAVYLARVGVANTHQCQARRSPKTPWLAAGVATDIQLRRPRFLPFALSIRINFDSSSPDLTKMATRPKRRMLTDRIREDLLYRLRWNVLATLDNIEIATGSYDQTTNVPLFGHPLADEPIAVPPFSRIDEVYIAECLDKVDFRHEIPEEYRYKPPPALTINNEDGNPITLGQFVTQTHAYLNVHIEELKKAKGELYGKVVTNEDGTWARVISDEPYLPPNIALFFSKVSAVQIGQIVQFSTHFFAEGENTHSTDQFWATQLRQAHSHERLHKDT